MEVPPPRKKSRKNSVADSSRLPMLLQILHTETFEDCQKKTRRFHPKSLCSVENELATVLNWYLVHLTVLSLHNFQLLPVAATGFVGTISCEFDSGKAEKFRFLGLESKSNSDFLPETFLYNNDSCVRPSTPSLVDAFSSWAPGNATCRAATPFCSYTLDLA